MISLLFFFFNDTATTEIYTLSLHDALPIFGLLPSGIAVVLAALVAGLGVRRQARPRSEEHTSELQSHVNLVCRLLLEKKKQKYHNKSTPLMSSLIILDARLINITTTRLHNH